MNFSRHLHRAPGPIVLVVLLLAVVDSLAQQTPDHHAQAEAVRLWILEHAVPLEMIEAGRGFADLEPLRRIVGDARIVALGEATHGTREFFQLKHRMLEFLVSEMGFDVFAMEATLPEAMDVNRYVLTGRGDPVRALAGMYFWTWDTEEVLELIRWMRRYNEDPRHVRKVKFYGFDMQYTPRAARVVFDYLLRVDPVAADGAEAVLEPLIDPFIQEDIRSRWPPRRKLALLQSIRKLAAGMDERREDYADRTSVDAWNRVRRHLHVLEQAMVMRAARGGGGSIRDSAMAENVAWLLEREGSGSKAVLWAHNLHVIADSGAMGWHLRRRFGDAIRTFGFSFDRGEFQARDVLDGALRTWRVESAPAGSVDGRLAAAGLELAALDLRGLPGTGPVADWFGAPRPMRSIGSGYAEKNPEWYWWRGRLTRAYDVLMFVRETTAARPNPTGRRPAALQFLPSPANMDFEEGEPGDPPPGWRGPPGIAGVEWQAALTREDARNGSQALVVRRTVDGGYGETHGQIEQSIKAVPWRGKHVSLSASVRVESTSPASRAYLWMKVTRPGEPWPETVFYENMADRPITAPEWRAYEIAAEVPEDADIISYGFAVVGSGQAWLDSVSLDGAAGSDEGGLR